MTKTTIIGTAILGVLVSANATFAPSAEAVVMKYNISGLLDDGGKFSGMFTYDNEVSDTIPENGKGSYPLIDCMVDVMSPTLGMTSFNSESGANCYVLATTETEPPVFGPVFEQDGMGLQVFFGFSGNPDVGPMIPMMLPNDTNPFQQMTDPPMGSEQSIFYKANGEIKVASAEIKKKVPEPTSTLSLLALGTIGAASTLKRKLKPSQSIEKETTKVG